MKTTSFAAALVLCLPAALAASQAPSAAVEVRAGANTVRVQFYADDIVRVLKWPAGGSAEKKSLAVVMAPGASAGITQQDTADGCHPLVAEAVRAHRQGRRPGELRDAGWRGDPGRGAPARLLAGDDAVREGVQRPPGFPAHARRGPLRPGPAPGQRDELPRALGQARADEHRRGHADARLDARLGPLLGQLLEDASSRTVLRARHSGRTSPTTSTTTSSTGRASTVSSAAIGG